MCIDTATRNAAPAHKKALLLNALGVEGVRIDFAAVEDQTQAGADVVTNDAEAADVYEEALAVLGWCFATEDEVATRLHLKRRLQGPEESTIDLLKDIQRLANACKFGAATDIVLKDQILGV